ncbi:MAG: tRNA (guanosine(46)-N7)-methyltransferase TrmB [Rhizobiales bacterium]|nr:tRNA (guanosine(46)-N7)-methyltransferase TrmB [Hyphomicrobiales bacterium]MDQ3560903.1 tRNA (guanine(46)-N(7))-methyltransferase TrmB [Pseudomonadota bacterium]
MQPRGGSFFGRRKGKTLKATQRVALDRAFPALRLDLTAPAPARLAALFPIAVDEVRLEIGFGGGEHLLHEARCFPETGVIGVEPFQNGLAKAVAAIAQESLTNIRLFDQDATLLLDWLPPDSLSRIDLLYPDPWPKLRHWKRRFVQAENIARIVRVLRAGGSFRFASDVEAYLKWAWREVGRDGRLLPTADGIEACRQAWPGWPGTRYEAKAVAEGRRPAYLEFRKLG